MPLILHMKCEIFSQKGKDGRTRQPKRMRLQNKLKQKDSKESKNHLIESC